MKSLSVGSLFKPIGQIIGKFHMTLFIVFIVAGLGVAVLFLASILNDAAGGDGYTSPINAGSIDQATLERIQELHTSQEGASTLRFPDGRVNPFAE